MRTLILAAILMGCAEANAQYVFKGFDINSTGGSYPRELTVMNGRLYFVAGNNNGVELFSTDGVHPNFSLVSDIKPGSGSSNPANINVLNGNKLIFTAEGDIANSTELWQSDGSAAGTSMIKDIYAGSVSSTPSGLTVYNGKVYFSAFGSNGAFMELWATDGTNVGTQMVKDINATGGSYPEAFCEYNGKLYFNATTDLEGLELWVTDGSDTGTKLVKDIQAGNMGSFPSNKIVVGNKMLFQIAAMPPAGSAVYETDGTAAGTKPFGKAGLNKYNNKFIINWNNKTYFDGGALDYGELWSSDGTAAGTALITPIGMAGYPVVYKNKLYFAATSVAGGTELWASDGTATGTVLVKDIAIGTSSSNPSNLIVYKDKLFFIAENAPADTQLFVSDGTDTGTHVMINPSGGNPNAFSSSAFNGFKQMNNVLYFAANYNGSGAELWSLEDTSKPVGITAVANTQRIELYPNPAKAVCNVIIDNAVYQKGSIQLCDMKGSVLQQQQLSAGQKHATIQLANIATGVYTIKVDVDGNIVNRKLVVQ